MDAQAAEKVILAKDADDRLGKVNRKIDAAQKQLLDLQASINEQKDELSRLQMKISNVQEAIAKVA